MRYLIIVVFLALFVFEVKAQPAMAAPSAADNLVFKLDKTNGKISLFQGSKAVATDFKVSKLELEIFDAKGEYAGTLELNSLDLPKAEVESYEKLKIAAIELTHTQTGEKIMLSDIAIVE